MVTKNKRMASPRIRPVPASTVSIDKILDRATDVIGDRDEASRWLGTPVRALNFATPVSLLTNAQGKEAVEIVLTKLEHGVL